MKKTFQLLLSVIVITAVVLGFVPARPVQAVSTTIVISQIYGGGGNSGATYKNDFIELYNLGSSAVDVTGWTVQYASAAGTSWTNKTTLSGLIQPGHYYLVQEAAGSGGTIYLPPPDAVGNIFMSATAGKVALVNNATALTGGCPLSNPAVVDFVGFGSASCFEGSPTAAPGNTTAVLRNGDGSIDTDNNFNDFIVGAPNPRNSLYPFSAVGLATPAYVGEGETALLTMAVSPGLDPASTGITVTCDLSSIGGSTTQPLYDDATHGDLVADDSVFSFSTADTTPGTSYPVCTFSDAEGRSDTRQIPITLLSILPIGTVNGVVADADNGTAHVSPYVGQTVTVKAVVYENTLQATANPAKPYYGIFIQNTAATADGNPDTSDGLFVYMGTYPDIKAPFGYYTPVVGDEIVITGKISEYYNMTELTGPTLIYIEHSGIDIDTEIAPVVADPPVSLADANRYWERMQGMRVQVPEDSIVLGGRNVFSPADAEVWIAGPDSTIAQRVDPYERRAFRDANPLDDNYDPTVWDGNGYRILMGSLGIKFTAENQYELISPARTFDTVTNAPSGGLNYTYSKYRIEITDQPTYAEGVDPAANNPVQEITDRTVAYNIVDYNLENLYDYRNNPFSGCDFAGDPGCPAVPPFIDKISAPFNYVPASLEAYQARIHDIALQIIDDLHSPDVLMVQEVENQDICKVTDGALDCGEVNNADGKPDVLQDLAIEIANLGGPSYDSAFDRDSSDLRGIAPAFMYRTDRVELVDPTGDPILGTTPAIDYPGAGVPANSDISNPKTLNAVLPEGISACETSWVFPRAASVALFRIFVGEIGDPFYNDVYVINNHFKSGPDSCVEHRTEQARYNAAIISYLETVNPDAKIVMGGDLNVYPEPDNTSLDAPEQLGALYEPALGLQNLWGVLLGTAPEAAYSYVYLGMAQTLDQMFVNQPLLGTLQDFKIAHINSDFPAEYPGDIARGTSDHDPNAATFAMSLEYGGFVSGGGWFTSPVDVYKAKFDFAAKYKNRSTVLTGDTELDLGNDMLFESTGYDWLSQVGNIAMLKGSGTINGEGEYNFLITLKDDSPDQIKVMIWDASGIVYDTGSLVNIGNGSIIFH